MISLDIPFIKRVSPVCDQMLTVLKQTAEHLYLLTSEVETEVPSALTI